MTLLLIFSCGRRINDFIVVIEEKRISYEKVEAISRNGASIVFQNQSHKVETRMRWILRTEGQSRIRKWGELVEATRLKVIYWYWPGVLRVRVVNLRQNLFDCGSYFHWDVGKLINPHEKWRPPINLNGLWKCFLSDPYNHDRQVFKCEARRSINVL